MCESIVETICEKGLRAKALALHEAVTAGTVRYEQVKGKRLQGMSRITIAIPVGWRYRLVYRMNNDKLVLVECCTHERYNNLIERLR